MGDIQPATKATHVGNDLVRLRIAALGGQHRDAAFFQCLAQRLRIFHNLRHVDLAIFQHFGSGHGQRRHAVDLMGGGQHGEDGLGQWFGQFGVIPHQHPALRPAKRLAGRPCQHGGSFAQRVLELPTSDESGLVCAVEDKTAVPRRNNLTHFPHRQGKQRHRHPHHHQLGLDALRLFLEFVQIHIQRLRVKRYVKNLHPPRPRRTIIAIAGMTTKRLRCRHHPVAGLHQGVVKRHVADHAAH